MPHWNHRVIKTTQDLDGRQEITWGIHEAHYKGDDESVADGGWTEHPTDVVTEDDADPIGSLRWTLERMLECLDKPILVNPTGSGDLFPASPEHMQR